jgi:hypothetical protein
VTTIPTSDEDTEPGPESVPARHRRRWPWIVGAVVVLFGVLGVVIATAWGGRDAREASVDDALSRFRRSDAGTDAGFLLPEPGVYTYRGIGTEQLSVLDAEQHWGARVPVTVSTTGKGCWTLRIDYSTNHRQDFDYCARDSTLVEMGGRTTQRFDFGFMQADDRTEFTCRPAGVAIRVDASAGERWKQTCTGHSDARDTDVTSSGTNRFLGVRHVKVAGRDIEAYAYRVDRTLTGDQSGVEHNELWFAAGSGLPVKYVRNTRVESPSPIGAVTYTEQGTLTLLTLHPRR